MLSDQPELMLRISQVGNIAEIEPDVIVIGQGLGQGDSAKQFLLESLRSTALLVIDADALNLIAANPLKVTAEQIQSDREVAI